MTQPSVLIVGAGAVGVVVGYHLGLGGTAVTFLVRPARLESLRAPQQLYCHDDGTLKPYSGYELVTTMSEVAARRFDFVLFTPDGASCRTPEGVRLLRELGDAIRPSPAVVILCAVGIGLREHVLGTLALPAQRLLEGTLGNACYQVSAGLPVLPPTDSLLLARASLAYRHFLNRAGLMLVPSPRDAARRFAALYDRCGVSRCVFVNAAVYRIYTNAFFAFTLASDIAGWPGIDGFAQRRDLLRLCVRAMREIAGLAQFGWMGKAVSGLLSEAILLRMLRKAERDLLPLDFAAFNRFHHGGKVLAQDVEVLRNCLLAGEAQGRPMSSLRELLRRFEAHRMQTERCDR